MRDKERKEIGCQFHTPECKSLINGAEAGGGKGGGSFGAPITTEGHGQEFISFDMCRTDAGAGVRPTIPNGGSRDQRQINCEISVY